MTKNVGLIAGLALAVLAGIWYLTMWAPASHRLSTVKTATAKALTTEQSLEARLAALVAIEHQLPAEEAQLRRSEPALPTSVAVNTLIDQIGTVAVTDGVQWSNESQSVTPATTTTAAATATTGGAPPGASTLAMTISVSGSYAQLAAFVHGLEHLPRLLVLDSVSFALATTGGGISADIDGAAYYDRTALPAAATAAPSSAG